MIEEGLVVIDPVETHRYVRPAATRPDDSR